MLKSKIKREKEKLSWQNLVSIYGVFFSFYLCSVSYLCARSELTIKIFVKQKNTGTIVFYTAMLNFFLRMNFFL